MLTRNFFSKLNKVVIAVIIANTLYTAVSYVNNQENHPLSKRSVAQQPPDNNNNNNKVRDKGGQQPCKETKVTSCPGNNVNMIDIQSGQNEGQPPKSAETKTENEAPKNPNEENTQNNKQDEKNKDNEQATEAPQGNEKSKEQLSDKQKHIQEVRDELEGRNRTFDFHPNCTMYTDDMKSKFRENLNVCGAQKPATEIAGEISLLSQLSETRLDSLQRIIKQWPGHVSATVYINGTDFDSVKGLMCDWLQSINRDNVQIHIVQDHSVWYHVNHMRNIAQDNAVTEYVYMCDVDFMIMPDLYKNLMKDVPHFFRKHDSFSNVLTIPALMAYENCTLPENKKRVDQEWDKCINRFDYGFPKFKGDPTNYTRWMLSNVPYKIPYAFHFEPYLIIKKIHSPRYEETFLQRWYDKMSHVLNQYSAGFQMWVYPHGYMVHMPHESAPINEFLYEKSKHCAGVYLRNSFRKTMAKGQKKLGLTVIDHWVQK